MRDKENGIRRANIFLTVKREAVSPGNQEKKDNRFHPQFNLSSVCLSFFSGSFILYTHTYLSHCYASIQVKKKNFHVMLIFTLYQRQNRKMKFSNITSKSIGTTSSSQVTDKTRLIILLN